MSKQEQIINKSNSVSS